MMHLRKLGALAGTAALFFGSACVDLDVTNPNNPDIERALASPEDVKSLAVSTMNDWFITSTYYEPYLVFQVTADATTGTYGNYGVRFNNEEPRIPYENSSAGGDKDVAIRPWDWNYGTLGAANDAVRAFTTGGIELPTVEETEAHLALARFTQSASMMNIALIFDRGFIVDEETPIGAELELQDYKAVSTAAMGMWDKAIAASAGKTYQFPSTVIPVQGEVPSVALLHRVGNTMAAMTLAYTPRTAAESDQVDWARVLGYAEKGIVKDFGVVGDATSWYSMMLGYSLSSWTVTDMRLMNRMDPQLSAKYTGSPDDLKPSTNTNADKRIGTDWRQLATATGAPERGLWMLSNWYHKRYEYHAYNTGTTFTGTIPYILKAENDLLIAEALVRTNTDLARAATLINNTRVGRGGLTPVTAATPTLELLRAIDYERDVELLNTNGFALFHARHWEGGPLDRLQEGTWLHLPIPAKELETLGLPIYTFGGVGKPVM
jgi:hypothetical protein